MNYGLTTERNYVSLVRTPFNTPEEKPRQLYCPFSKASDPCGEWCPMFEVERNSTKGIRVMLSCVPVRRIIAFDLEE